MIDDCFSIGFNYRSIADRERGRFALDRTRQQMLYEEAPEIGVRALSILSTCNRTEIYGIGDAGRMQELYLKTIEAIPQESSGLFVKRGKEAIHHMFNVAAGLDSQIVGDREILGQFRNAFRTAKQHQRLNGFFERLANTCIQASKEVRSKTRLSDGTVSVSYAAVKFLKERDLPSGAKVLLIGAGELGKGISKNISAHLPSIALYLCNRTPEKALRLAKDMSTQVIPFESLHEKLAQFDVIVIAIGETHAPVITADMLRARTSPAILLDMSIPSGVGDGVRDLPEVEVITIDTVSQLINTTLSHRRAELPVAQEIIAKYVDAFHAWSVFYKNKHSITLWKSIITRMTDECPHLGKLPEDEKDALIRQSVARFSVFLREQSGLHGRPDVIIAKYLEKTHGKFVPEN